MCYVMYHILERFHSLTEFCLCCHDMKSGELLFYVTRIDRWNYEPNDMTTCADDQPHWGWVTHICVSKQTIIGSDNGLSPGRRQAIISTNDGILSIRHLGTNVSEILIKIHTFSFKKIHLKMSSGKLRPFCLGLDELTATLTEFWPAKKIWHFAVLESAYLHMENVKTLARFENR